MGQADYMPPDHGVYGLGRGRFYADQADGPAQAAALGHGVRDFLAVLEGRVPPRD